MKQRKHKIILVLSFIVLSLSWACGGGETTTSPTPSPSPAGTVNTPAASPSPAASPAETATITKEEVEKIYKGSCAACHSEDGKGKKAINPNMPDFTDAKWQAAETDEELNAAITNGKGTGKGAMPKWSPMLNAEQIKGLVAYVRTFKK